MSLPAAALALALASALVHASWNVLLARVPRGPDAAAVGTALGLLAWTPLALARWRVEAAAWPYLLLSAAFELAYFAALTLAYARAPAHAAYPVARGVAPVLLVPVAALAGGRVPVWVAGAVAAISVGVLLTGWGAVNRRAVWYALPVALCIAGYTFVDARGLRHADPATYLWLCMLPVVAGLLGYRIARARGTAALRTELRPATFALGLGVFGAYGLTLAALAMVTVAQVPAIAALRETSILFVIALSWRPSSEQRPGLATAAGAALVFAGVALLALA